MTDPGLRLSKSETDSAGLLFITAKEAAKRARERADTLGEQSEVMGLSPGVRQTVKRQFAAR